MEYGIAPLDGAGGVKAQGVLQHISTIKNDLQNTDDRNQWAKTEFGESMADAAGLYQEKLLEQNMLDFDDMMLWSIRLLHETSRRAGEAPGPVRAPARRRVQDTNLPQYVFIRQLANDRNNVFVVGDPDPAIYEWRGASIENIMQFEEDFAGAQRIDLDTTYRSTKNILEAANALIQPNKARIAREIDTTQDRGEPVQLLPTPTPTSEAEHAAKTAQARIEEDGGSVAVLYRTNAQARQMERASSARRSRTGSSAANRSTRAARCSIASSCINVATGGLHLTVPLRIGHGRKEKRDSNPVKPKTWPAAVGEPHHNHERAHTHGVRGRRTLRLCLRRDRAAGQTPETDAATGRNRKSSRGSRNQARLPESAREGQTNHGRER